MSLIAQLGIHSSAGSAGQATASRLGTDRVISPLVLSGVLRIAEFLTVIVTGALTAIWWQGLAAVVTGPGYLTAFALTAFAYLLLAERLELHSTVALSAPMRHPGRLLLALASAIALLGITAILLNASIELSRAWVLSWFATGAGGLLALRAATSAFVRQLADAGQLQRRAVIYGAGPPGQAVVAALEADPASDVAICGIFDDRGGERSAALVGAHKRLGNADELLAFCRVSRVDLLIIALPITAEARLLEILRKVSVLPVDIRLAALDTKLRLGRRAYSWAGEVPFIDLLDKPLSDWDVIVKSAMDKVVATLALLVLAPIMALVALAIRLESRGPILFRQKRVGFNNELIEVLKFRSMYSERCDAHGARSVTRTDPRVTRVGRFIRKTSLDELPQLINVLHGDLSLVGPRPHALQSRAHDQLFHEIVDGYFARHKVKPGITGWAQVNGWRGETDTAEKILKRVEYDLHYIENWSILFDLYILARTPIALLRSGNAY